MPGSTTEQFDAVVVGAGIMGATMAGLLARLEPDWRIAVVEQLPDAGRESSHAWHNAGTGHAGLCEFNYTPRTAGGVDISSALAINGQFQVSCQYWAHLVETGTLGDPAAFIRPVPHFSFAHGPAGVEYLRARYRAMAGQQPFAAMEYSEDPAVLAGWLPLMFGTRPPGGPVAVTRVAAGTDLDYGELSRKLLADAAANGAGVGLGQQVAGLRRDGAGWVLSVRLRPGWARRLLRARYVFLAAGGATLPLLQRAGIPETRTFGGFPISGRFYRTAKPDLVARHRGKVYGHAAEGAPPISVPHLDLRVVDGREYLLFGPYGAFSPRFLKSGSLWDLARSVRPANLPTLLAAARDNASLVAYLVRQILQQPGDRFAELRRFVPDADPADWKLVAAGQRVQVVKSVQGKGTIAGFGTEVVTSAGGSLAALLGASPGASASVSIVLDVLRSSFPGRFPGWEARIREMIPSYGALPHEAPGLVRDARDRALQVLGLHGPAGTGREDRDRPAPVGP